MMERNPTSTCCFYMQSHVNFVSLISETMPSAKLWPMEIANVWIDGHATDKIHLDAYV